MTAARLNICIQPPRHHEGQRRIIESKKRFKVISAGRRFGKTVVAMDWLVFGAGAAIDGGYCGFFAPTYKLLMEVWKKVRRALRPITSSANKTEMQIELVTGGVLDFWTLEDEGAGRGRHYHRVVIDEAAHSRNLAEVWQKAILPTLTDFKGSAWFISTPNGLNFFHELHQRGGDPAFPDWESFLMPTTENPFIDPEVVADFKAQLPPLIFMQEYLAQFVTFGSGMVSPEQIRLGTAPADAPTFIGVDLALSTKEGADYTAIVVVSYDSASGVVYVREAERMRGSFHAVLERIKQSAERWRPAAIGIEQVQFQAAVIQELARTTVLPVRGIRPDKDKITRFLPMAAKYANGLAQHDPSGVPAWFREELIAFPQADHDDGVDALVYAFITATTMGGGEYATAGRRRFTL